MNTPAKLAALSLAALLLAGCSSISEGTITAKKHSEGYYYVTQQCIVYGKYGCTSWMPITQHMPEAWWFDLASSSGNIDDKPETGWVYVGSKTFDQYEVGDYFEGASS